MSGDGLNQVRCIECSKFSFVVRVAKHDARNGLGRCLNRPDDSPVRFRAKVDRECEGHLKTDIEVIRSRVEWLKKQKGME